MNKKFIKNKRADIPVMILVLGVVAVCGLAILSFTFSIDPVKNYLGVGLIEEMNVMMEKYYFYSGLSGFGEERAESILGVKKDKEGKRFLYLEKKEGDKVLVSVKYKLNN